MNLLCLESSTEACSVALSTPDGIIERSAIEPRAHARLMLPWARELLAEAGLGWSAMDALAVDIGPGGFTSLRIGLGITQGIALAHDLPVHPVSSLRILAESADPERVRPWLMALLDARMGEVYAACYHASGDGRELIGGEWLTRPDELSAPTGGPWWLAGPGVSAHRDALIDRLGNRIAGQDADAWPQASTLARLAPEVAPVPGHQLIPTYLRDQVTG